MTAPLVLPLLGIQLKIAIEAIPGDGRVWVPQAQDVWSSRKHYIEVGLGTACVDQFIR